MQNKFKVSDRSIVQVSLLLTWIYLTHFSGVFYFWVILKMWMVDRILITIVNNSFQPLPIFLNKKLHLRYCMWLESNIVTWSTKIFKGIGGAPNHQKHNLLRKYVVLDVCTHIDIYSYSNFDLSYIFYHQTCVYICMMYVLLMFFIYLFFLSN